MAVDSENVVNGSFSQIGNWTLMIELVSPPSQAGSVLSPNKAPVLNSSSYGNMVIHAFAYAETKKELKNVSILRNVPPNLAPKNGVSSSTQVTCSAISDESIGPVI
ncbi:hypothetical protein ACH5RR_003104 [Cinchona calisaya]|uniref:Uncharacterized protein n=1 Tax=Cinchona calisaya TaxID=153742 RepID=A0ABD3AU00_9GENT